MTDLAGRKCFRCGGPYSEVSGDYDKKWDVAFCGPCIMSFYSWLSGHLRRKWGKMRFYEEALTSIKAK